MSHNLDNIAHKLDNPKHWEEAERQLLDIIKNSDVNTRMAADILLKNLQRKKFNRYLKRFDQDELIPKPNEVTMQRTVTRTLSMIIPRGLKQDASETESDNEEIPDIKQLYLTSNHPRPPNKPLPSYPIIPPKPAKLLPKVPVQPPILPLKDFKASQQDLKVDKSAFEGSSKAPSTYYPTLEEIESQFVPPHKSSQRQVDQELLITQIEQKYPPVEQFIKQEEQPLYPESSNQDYKLNLLQNYLSVQRQMAKEKYAMDSPQLDLINRSDNIDVHSSVSNQPSPFNPVQRYDPAPIVHSPVKSPVKQVEEGPHLGLNTVYLPKLIIHEFMKVAQINTSRNIETCGLLAGKLRKIKKSSIKQQSAFLITHLIVPQQSGTPDSCVMESEELVANFQIDNNLITLGWIHTHPTQTVNLIYLVLHVLIRFTYTFPFSVDIT